MIIGRTVSRMLADGHHLVLVRQQVPVHRRRTGVAGEISLSPPAS
jgi:hypothetical protein